MPRGIKERQRVSVRLREPSAKGAACLTVTRVSHGHADRSYPKERCIHSTKAPQGSTHSRTKLHLRRLYPAVKCTHRTEIRTTDATSRPHVKIADPRAPAQLARGPTIGQAQGVSCTSTVPWPQAAHAHRASTPPPARVLSMLPFAVALPRKASTRRSLTRTQHATHTKASIGGKALSPPAHPPAALLHTPSCHLLARAGERTGLRT